jgi:hypothetical protein
MCQNSCGHIYCLSCLRGLTLVRCPLKQRVTPIHTSSGNCGVDVRLPVSTMPPNRLKLHQHGRTHHPQTRRAVQLAFVVRELILYFLSGEAEYATFSKLSSASAAAAFGGIETATCPGCAEVYMIEDADARRVSDVPARTSRCVYATRLPMNSFHSCGCRNFSRERCDCSSSGDTMQLVHRKHYAKFRLRCIKERCGLVFCGGCEALPYHEGYTCDEWRRREDGLSCR